MKLLRYLLIITLILLAYLAALIIWVVPYGWVIVTALLMFGVFNRSSPLSAFGTARWATAKDIPHMLEGNRILLGTMPGKVSLLEGVLALLNRRLDHRQAVNRFLTACQRKQPSPVVRLTKAVHTAVFAPTGVGKGVSCVIPHLLTCPDSMVVIDFKGENAKLTAQARRKMGHKVVIIDPFKVVTQTPDTLNPIEFIDKDSATALDECRDISEALVTRTGQEKEPHWNDSAETWIAAMTATVTAFAEDQDKSLQSVRALLTNPEKMQAAIKLMCESDQWDGMLARLGFQLTHFKDKELASTLTTTNRFMRFLDTVPISDNTRTSSFNPSELITGKMTVYLVLPPEHMRAQSALLRLWIGTLLRAVVKGGLQDETKVHFVLDEAASLGHMAALEDAVDKYRGYGVRLFFLYQSLGQLKKCWPEGQDQTLLSNVSQVFFGVNDPQTAEYVSNRLGEFTQVVSSGGTSSGTSYQVSQQGSDNRSYSSNASDNWQQHGRKLLKPEEVMALPERVAITFTQGAPPIRTWLMRYYEHGFSVPKHMGMLKSAFDTACLFCTALILAVMFTVGIFFNPSS